MPVRYQVAVRYGVLKNVENAFTQNSELRKGDKVIMRSFRGIEIGETISQPQVLGDEAVVTDMGEVLHKATEEEEKKQEEIEKETIPSEYKFCQEKIKEHNLPMKLASVEHLFGSKKIILHI